MMRNKCIFLDRDGVINREQGEYTYLVEDFVIQPGVIKAMKQFKKAGYLLIVITNQAGISRNLYTREHMEACHDFLQKECGNIIDHIYYSPYHPSVSESLMRKSDSLMFEKAMDKYQIDPKQSWMIGDKERDLIPAKKFEMKTVLMSADTRSEFADYSTHSFTKIVNTILKVK